MDPSQKRIISNLLLIFSVMLILSSIGLLVMIIRTPKNERGSISTVIPIAMIPIALGVSRMGTSLRKKA